MARAALFARRLNSLVPTDATAAEALDGVRHGEVVKVEITRPRNMAQHRWLFAVVDAVYDAQDVYPTRDQLRAALSCAVGWADTVKLPDGRIVLIPRSWATDRMDGEQFEEVCRRVIRLICTRIVPGLDEPVLRAEIEARLAGQGSRGGRAA